MKLGVSAGIALPSDPGGKDIDILDPSDDAQPEMLAS
jgi:hypothetical protein